MDMHNCCRTLNEKLSEDLFAPLPCDTVGKFVKYTYYSSTTGRDTNVNILLPPGYDKRKKYPVLYFLHGYFSSEDWLTNDIPDFPAMLYRLYGSGEAKEMIVVCPYIFCSRTLPHCTGMNLENSLCYDNFINELFSDLMPFVGRSFSAAKERECTAITGFSMGGREALFIGFKRPDRFGYVGAAAPAPGLTAIDGSVDHPGQLDESEMAFDLHHPMLMITASDSDNAVGEYPKSYSGILSRNKTAHIWQEIHGAGHDAGVVKPHLYSFCRRIFR